MVNNEPINDEPQLEKKPTRAKIPQSMEIKTHTVKALSPEKNNVKESDDKLMHDQEGLYVNDMADQKPSEDIDDEEMSEGV